MTTILNPKANTCFSVLNNRLALFHAYNDHLAYWSGYWNNRDYLTSLVANGKKGNLGEFHGIVGRFVNKEHLVLEAGCGPGHLVAALTALGYKAIGIDYEMMVVGFADGQLADGSIVNGNVLSLGIADASIGCYMSLGVVEHFIDGPFPALIEARRILRQDGIALISVPYLNPKRQSLLNRLHKEAIPSKGKNFHQYYFSVREFEEILLRAGLRMIEWYPYAVQAFLTREHPVFNRLWQLPFMPYRIQKLLLYLLKNAPMVIRKNYGHMVMFVAHPI